MQISVCGLKKGALHSLYYIVMTLSDASLKKGIYLHACTVCMCVYVRLRAFVFVSV